MAVEIKNKRDMKEYLFAIVLMFTLGQNADAASQKHRHTPRTEQVDTAKNKQDAVEAFSDTTSAAESDDAEDDKYITYRHGTTYSSGDVQELKDVMDTVGGFFGGWVAISIVAIVVIFLLAPLLIIIAIFYFVNKNRKERYKLAQMAIQNGQPIPDEILKDNTDAKMLTSEYQAGIRQMFVGVGLAIFLGIIIGKLGIGIGALVFFIGLGKWYVSRQSGDNINNMHNNNRSNIQDYE